MKFLSTVVFLTAYVVFVSAEFVRHWNRQIDEFIAVNEFVFINKEKQKILMSASDSKLKETKYLQSISLHDFKAKDSKGLVALKVFDSNNRQYCFISDVANSFDETIEEVKKRRYKTIPLTDPKKYFEFGEEDKIKKDDLNRTSEALAEFCNDVTTYKLSVIERAEINPKFDDRFFHTLCLWYPYPIAPLFPWFPWPVFP